jgi:hypothetical protein
VRGERPALDPDRQRSRPCDRAHGRAALQPVNSRAGSFPACKSGGGEENVRAMLALAAIRAGMSSASGCLTRALTRGYCSGNHRKLLCSSPKSFVQYCTIVVSIPWNVDRHRWDSCGYSRGGNVDGRNIVSISGRTRCSCCCSALAPRKGGRRCRRPRKGRRCAHLAVPRCRRRAASLSPTCVPACRGAS